MLTDFVIVVRNISQAFFGQFLFYEIPVKDIALISHMQEIVSQKHQLADEPDADCEALYDAAYNGKHNAPQDRVLPHLAVSHPVGQENSAGPVVSLLAARNLAKNINIYVLLYNANG